jgi:hypothetical protein
MLESGPRMDSVFTLAITALVGLSLSTAKAGEDGPTRIGQIFIVGNTATPEWVILRQLPLFPGGKLDAADLIMGERNLERLGLFRRPTVKILDPEKEQEYKDILVSIEEKPWNWLIFDALDLVEARLTLNLEGMSAAGVRFFEHVRERLR